ncbi:restriction endonuclease subunit S [Campylobacter upsaliensis]|uniref:restriction endonuclease subunit S n=1 Tax=Campylobacter upsaliensis TaxID=28080 RepID=UPI0022EA3506|nr:restriction endonuclease subunit S [Campylobacter upsaliensis]
MKTDTLKKSLLDYAIKGRLSAKFRRENNGLNAFDEINTYNEAIKEKRKNLEKELKKCEKEFKLEKDKDKKAFLKSQIQSLKKEIAKCKEITPLNLSEAPFEIPNSWAWVKLGDICEIFTGDSINATEKEKNFTHQTSGLNYIATKDLANDTSITYENGIKIPDEFLPSFKIAKANSTLLCIEGGSAGRKVGFLKENVCFGNKLCCFENIFAFSKFVFYFLQSGEFSKEFNSNINGIIGGVKKESIRHFLIPLPPLCEQQEIVKKLDLLVTLANDFAITKENLKRIEKRIEKSLLKLALEGSLSKLYRRSSPTLSAFNEINTYNDNIKEKRKDLEKKLKICEKEFKLEKDKEQKAFLKSQIQMLKKELTKCKEITPLNFSEAPFTIPNSWAWVKLGDICEDLFAGGDKPQLFSSTQTENCQVPIYTNGVKNNGLYGFTNEAYVKKSAITISGRGTIGFVCVRNEPFYPIIRLLVAIPNEAINLNYLAYVLMPLIPKSSGTSIPQLTIPMIQNLSIPLPPLKEQEYITQILDTLFTLKKGLRVD